MLCIPALVFKSNFKSTYYFVILFSKEPLDSSILQDSVLDIERDGKLHVVFGGTMVVQHSLPSKSSGLKAPDNGCIGYVLRTGFSTSQVRIQTYKFYHKLLLVSLYLCLCILSQVL